jgi:hypothetical protein
MKTKYIIGLLIVLMLGGCAKKEEPDIHFFKPSLENIITYLIDSLGNEIGKDKLLSIQFIIPKHDEFDLGMRIFLSDWYASGCIEGYAIIDSTTIAIYSIKDDYYELVNKNAIRFFTDTLVGFKDVCGWKTSESDVILPQFCYLIYEEDSISRIPSQKTFGSYPAADMIRRSKCKDLVSFTLPVGNREYDKIRFYYDSIHAENEFEYYKKEVDYYRNMSDKTKFYK